MSELVEKSEVFEIADRYISEQAALDPIMATFQGIEGQDGELTDYSPQGHAARAELARRYADRIRTLSVDAERDLIAKEVMLERLDLELDGYENRDQLRDLAFSWSAAQAIRSVFDLMSYKTRDDWEVAAKRLSGVPAALKSAQTSLREGMDQGVTVARRQVTACARQARVWAGTDVENVSFFRAVLEQHPDADIGHKVRDKLVDAADNAATAFDEYSAFLIDVYLPAAVEDDGVGRDRYERAADGYLGMRIDPEETYAWGWEELAGLKAEIDTECAEIKAGASLPEVIEMLNDDHERWIHGEDALVVWLKGLLDRAMTGLDGKFFDIPEPLRRLDVRIAPPGGPANQYYTAPSEDLSRPGTYWYPIDGKTRFAIWSEISTAYHEGVPGHHLQNGIVKMLSSQLSRFQRNMFISGHGEGWALYAERLMDEAGFYDRPEYKLDMLLSQYFRAARVVVDIGLHLSLKDRNGDVWTPESAHTFMLEHSNLSDSFIASEIVRYLGIPGQAISYKVGERVWREARQAAARTQGPAFDLKNWHNTVLALGPMGLTQLKNLAGR